MAHSPSQKWEDGRLVERAQDARGEAEENEAVAVTGRPVKRFPPNSTFSSRRAARLGTKTEAAEGEEDTKAISAEEAEDKAVRSSERKTRRKTR